jgi:hypothetical protein
MSAGLLCRGGMLDVLFCYLCTDVAAEAVR